MKKILVLVLALMMSVNCKAQLTEFVIALGEIVGAVQTGSSIGKWIFSSSHEDDLKKGLGYYDAENYEDAIATLSIIDASDLDVVRVVANYYRGICFLYLEKYQKAKVEFDKVLNFETSFNTLYKDDIADFKGYAYEAKVLSLLGILNSPNSYEFWQGYLSFISGEYSKAFVNFSKINENDKPLLRIMAHYYKGECRNKQNEKGKALINYKRAIYFSVPIDAECPNEITKYQQLAQEGVDNLICDEAVDINEINIILSLHSVNSADYIDGLGAYKNGKYSKAFDYFSKINENDKPLLRIMAHYYKGECRNNQNEKGKALINYKRAVYFPVSEDAENQYEIKKYQKLARKKIDNLMNDDDIDVHIKNELSSCKMDYDLELKFVDISITFANNLKSDNYEKFIQGVQCYRESKYDTALEYLDCVGETDASLLRDMAHYYKGQCRFEQQQYDKALINFKRAVNLRVPSDALYRFHIQFYQRRAQLMIDYVQLLVK